MEDGYLSISEAVTNCGRDSQGKVRQKMMLGSWGCIPCGLQVVSEVAS